MAIGPFVDKVSLFKLTNLAILWLMVDIPLEDDLSVEYDMPVGIDLPSWV